MISCPILLSYPLNVFPFDFKWFTSSQATVTGMLMPFPHCLSSDLLKKPLKLSSWMDMCCWINKMAFLVTQKVFSKTIPVSHRLIFMWSLKQMLFKDANEFQSFVLSPNIYSKPIWYRPCASHLSSLLHFQLTAAEYTTDKWSELLHLFCKSLIFRVILPRSCFL